jgi:hypothetical protein
MPFVNASNVIDTNLEESSDARLFTRLARFVAASRLNEIASIRLGEGQVPVSRR